MIFQVSLPLRLSGNNSLVYLAHLEFSRVSLITIHKCDLQAGELSKHQVN